MTEVFIANGHPKSGTHALKKAMELLGLPTKHGHYKYSDKPSDRLINIIRNPKNILISWLRFNEQPVTEGMFKSKLQLFEEPSKTFIDSMNDHLGYITDNGVLTVRYEDLIATDVAMKHIATWAGIDYIQGAFEELPGFTKTWKQDHSDYSTIWNASLEQFWIDNGGAELDSAFGY